jgi:hypothetical protein
VTATVAPRAAKGGHEATIALLATDRVDVPAAMGPGTVRRTVGRETVGRVLRHPVAEAATAATVKGATAPAETAAVTGRRGAVRSEGASTATGSAAGRPAAVTAATGKADSRAATGGMLRAADPATDSKADRGGTVRAVAIRATGSHMMGRLVADSHMMGSLVAGNPLMGSLVMDSPVEAIRATDRPVEAIRATDRPGAGSLAMGRAETDRSAAVLPPAVRRVTVIAAEVPGGTTGSASGRVTASRRRDRVARIRVVLVATATRSCGRAKVVPRAETRTLATTSTS